MTADTTSPRDMALTEARAALLNSLNYIGDLGRGQQAQRQVKKAIDHIDAALQSGLEGGGWKPIEQYRETEPVVVLTIHRDDLFPVCAYRMSNGDWYREVEGPEDVSRPGAHQRLYRLPTHFLPLDTLKTAPPSPDLSGWQPIETAPKDGSEFFSYGWSDYRQKGWTSIVVWNEEADCFIDETGSTQDRLTHWQKLPAPPSPDPAIRKQEDSQ